MKLPPESVIAPEKVWNYLLLPQVRGDKSQFLALAGYTLAHAEQLLEDLRKQILPLDATLRESSKFGDKYEIRGVLTGPNGNQLRVRTFWMKDADSSVTRFITLVPNRRMAL